MHDLTRQKGEGKKEKGPGWLREYAGYLQRPYRTLAGAFAKLADAISNLLELRLEDKSKREEIAERAIAKAALQLPYWQKISWVVARLLLGCIRRAAELTDSLNGISNYLYLHTRRQIDDFKKGFAMNGYRSDPQIHRTISASGTFTVDIYRVKKKSESTFEIEIPFVDRKVALQIIKAAFGEHLDHAKSNATSLLPYVLRTATITRITLTEGVTTSAEGFFVENDEGKQVNLALSLVSAYDKHIRKSIAKGFDRSSWAHAAYMRNAALKEEMPGLPEQQRQILAEVERVRKAA